MRLRIDLLVRDRRNCIAYDGSESDRCRSATYKATHSVQNIGSAML